MKKIIDITAYFFIGTVTVLTIISILGVWEMLAEDTVRKSFQSIAILGVAALVIMFSAKYFDDKENQENTGEALDLRPGVVFKKIRKTTITLLISIVAIVAFVGILAVWDVFDGVVVGKSFATMAIVAFSSFVIVVTCLYREKDYR